MEPIKHSVKDHRKTSIPLWFSVIENFVIADFPNRPYIMLNIKPNTTPFLQITMAEITPI